MTILLPGETSETTETRTERHEDQAAAEAFSWMAREVRFERLLAGWRASAATGDRFGTDRAAGAE